MASPTTLSSSRPRHSKLVRCIAIIMLALIVLVAAAVLIIWLTIKPKRPIYSIEEGSVHNFSLSNVGRLNSTFNFVLRAYNPNTKVSIYHDRIETKVLYDDESLATGTVDPFFQSHANVTHLGLNLTGRGTVLTGSVTRDLKLERSSGAVELEVRVRARIRFKVGSWKSRHRTMKISCEPLLVHFSSTKPFERTFCSVDL